MTVHRLIEQIKRHEGFRGRPYTDTTGHTTIGYGRNLEAWPLTKDEGAYLLQRDMAVIEKGLAIAFRATNGLDPVRFAALHNMAYNLGITRLRKFRRMWMAIESRNWPLAADEAMDSLWARQVKGRAHDIAYMIRTGDWPDRDQ